jgi:hypothetical protein
MSLLDKAKQVRTNHASERYTKEEVELCEAWLNDEIGYTAIAKVTGKTTTQVYCFLALCLRQMYRDSKEN